MRLHNTLYFKIAGASFLVVTAVLAFVGLVEYRDQRRLLAQRFGDTLQHTAQTAALFLDGDAHARVRGAADAAGPDFAVLRATLARVARENGLREDQLYTLRPRGGAYAFVLMLQGHTFVGDRYAPTATNGAIMRAALADGVARHSPIYSDANGTYASAYAPVREHAGRVVALLEADATIAG